jgi:hypothetical protein
MGRAIEGFFAWGLPDVVPLVGELTNDLYRVESHSPGTRGSTNKRSLLWRKYLLNTDLIDQMLSP